MLSHAGYVAVKDRAADEFLEFPGVRLVGLGNRERGGRITAEYAIKVFVDRKLSSVEIPEGQRLPGTFEGVAVDVVGMAQAAPALPAPSIDPALTGVPLPDEEQTERNEHRVLIGTKRTLVGGTALNWEEGASNAYGTLGCFLVDSADPERKVYALSNFHVLGFSSEDEAKPGVSKVGQPRYKEKFPCCCCQHRIGLYTQGGFAHPPESPVQNPSDPRKWNYDGVVDAGIVRLDEGMNWQPYVPEMGLISGAYSKEMSDALPVGFEVKKRGIRTKATGGTIAAVNAVGTVGYARRLREEDVKFRNLIVVRPKDNPSLGAKLYFSAEGDSGSALFDHDNKVIGLVFAGFAPKDPVDEAHPEGDPLNHVGWSRVVPISAVLEFFRAKGLTLEVATETDFDRVRTVPRTTPASVGVVPKELAEVVDGEGVVALPGPGTLERLRTDLRRSMAGRRLLRLWDEYGAELSGLLDTHRRVAIAWHRGGGPALFQTLVRMLDQPETALPSTIGGVPTAAAIGRFHDIFAEVARPDLRSALARTRSAVPDVAGMTYAQIIGAFDAAGEVLDAQP